MLNFIDKSFSARKTKQYNLSIQVDLDGFSFCVFDTIQKKYVALRSIPADLSVGYDLLADKIYAIYREVEYLNEYFAKCSCIYTSQKNTLVPASYFSQEKLRSFLDFVYPLDELDELHYKPIAGTDAIALFAVPHPISAELFVKHKNIQFYNQSVPIIHNLLKKKSEQHLCINVNGSIADLALSSGGKLIFHSSFSVSGAYDTAYFALFTLKQLSVSPEHIEVSITGCLPDEMLAVLKGYLPRAAVDGGVEPSLPIAPQHMAAYFQLLTLCQCE